MNYYRRFLGDYASKTADLSLAEHGAYTVLLDISYSTEAGLPAAYDALFRLCRAMTRPEQDAVKVVADRFFPICPDGLRRNPRAAEEIANAQAIIDKQRKSGADSAHKRWSTDRSTHKSTDGSTHAEPIGSTDGSTGRSAIQPPTTNLQPPTANHQTKDKSKPASRSAPTRKKTLMPSDFEVSERVKVWAEGKGFTRLDEHLDSFKRKCAAKGYMNIDWDAAFMEAVREDWAKLRSGIRGVSSSGDGPDFSQAVG